MSNVRVSATPMTIGLQLTYEMNKKGCNKPFAEVIGSLMFAVVVNRPGIAFAVSLMNHYILVFNKKTLEDNKTYNALFKRNKRL